ncbi:MAG: TlyA family RNA methyltransferase [Chloroflexi bacterium]|nr:TlyA family RNA methyltransferase [Chloroflexota bacterium]
MASVSRRSDKENARTRTPRRRIDLLMVERGLAESRARAQALLMAGEVVTGGQAVTKPGTLVPADAEIRIKEAIPYVSRGGLKLEYALERFNVDVRGMVALDVGASTGGFTDCLLQRGAARVYAIDVGRGQIDYRLRADPRVVVMERVNARYPFDIPEQADIAAIDVSFISATMVAPNAARVLKPRGWIIVLVKPQFEARKEEVGKGGVIKDPRVHAGVLGRFIAWAIDSGYRLRDITASPITGAEGNREFLALLSVQNGMC